MKKLISPILKTTAILFICSLLNSCNKNDNSITAYADVFVQKKLDDGITKYSKVCYITAFSPLNSASVNLPDNTDMDLNAYKSDYYFLNESNSTQYEESFPLTGTYLFKAIYDGEQIFEASDILESEELEFPVFVEANYDNDNERVYLAWDSVPNTDGYIIRLFEQNGEVIFNSPMLTNDSNEYYFGLGTSSTWYATPCANTSYNLAVIAVLFDDDATNTNFSYNIQCHSTTETEIIWNPSD